jgi:hypothetical protein
VALLTTPCAALPTYTDKSKAVSKRTKEGYLSKRGGSKGNMGWQKRWFSLSDGALKYYADKDKKPNGIIPVDTMVDVRWSASKDKKHTCPFELDTATGRTYYFSADTVMTTPPPLPPARARSLSSNAA